MENTELIIKARSKDLSYGVKDANIEVTINCTDDDVIKNLMLLELCTMSLITEKILPCVKEELKIEFIEDFVATLHDYLISLFDERVKAERYDPEEDIRRSISIGQGLSFKPPEGLENELSNLINNFDKRK